MEIIDSLLVFKVETHEVVENQKREKNFIYTRFVYAAFLWVTRTGLPNTGKNFFYFA